MSTLMETMTVEPLSEALGAKITGIDAAELDETTFGKLRGA